MPAEREQGAAAGAAEAPVVGSPSGPTAQPSGIGPVARAFPVDDGVGEGLGGSRLLPAVFRARTPSAASSSGATEAVGGMGVLWWSRTSGAQVPVRVRELATDRGALVPLCQGASSTGCDRSVAAATLV
ncbi:hypothetical protein [Streptomyces luteolus]|uniref:Uncharacterized protein n=1 Tax=Streptomyces luteolus TaxID=3043615 RepID=A0ABT6SU76_9ACTN|nr:hypothetical protein [Streptomyces sp. B-S-A12]MDI3419167.1 hypothetical protein [Streptomyces sp. B-S-A12]